jgi:transposase
MYIKYKYATYSNYNIDMHSNMRHNINNRLEVNIMADIRYEKIKELQGNGTLNKCVKKVQSPLFKDNIFFDPNDLLQVKYEMLRSIEKDCTSVSSTSREFGFSRVAYYQAKVEFGAHGIAGLIPKKRGPKKARKLKQVDVEFIQQMLSNNPKMTKKQLLEKLDEERGIKISKRTVERALNGKKKHHE